MNLTTFAYARRIILYHRILSIVYIDWNVQYVNPCKIIAPTWKPLCNLTLPNDSPALTAPICYFSKTNRTLEITLKSFEN